MYFLKSSCRFDARYRAGDGADDVLELVEEIAVRLVGSRAHSRGDAPGESGQRVTNWLR